MISYYNLQYWCFTYTLMYFDYLINVNTPNLMNMRTKLFYFILMTLSLSWELLSSPYIDIVYWLLDWKVPCFFSGVSYSYYKQHHRQKKVLINDYEISYFQSSIKVKFWISVKLVSKQLDPDLDIWNILSDQMWI